MATIINLRGTNGSGKSTLVRSLMDNLGVVSPIVGVGSHSKRAWAYLLHNHVFVCGRYETACGGADTIGSFAELGSALSKLATGYPDAKVIVEGSLFSTVYRGTVELARSLPGHKFVFGIMDTPLELCIQRVIKRRAEAGNTRPFNPEKVRVKHGSVLSSAARLKADGYDVRTVQHQSAVETVFAWLRPPEVV